MNAKKVKQLRKLCKGFSDVPAKREHSGTWGIDLMNRIFGPTPITVKYDPMSRRRIYQDAKRKFNGDIGLAVGLSMGAKA